MSNSSKKTKTQERLYTVFFMFIVTFISISVLTTIYLITKEIIEKNKKILLHRAILYTANIEAPQSKEEMERVFSERIKEVNGSSGTPSYYQVLDTDGSIKGYVFLTIGKGLWGKIESVVGVDKDMKTITGLDFTQQEETPGLGARIEESWFKEQFRGKNGPLDMIPEKEKTQVNQFQAITGATITSTGVKEMLNKILEEIPTKIKG